jgi:hypothetical protein
MSCLNTLNNSGIMNILGILSCIVYTCISNEGHYIRMPETSDQNLHPTKISRIQCIYIDSPSATSGLQYFSTLTS